MAPLKEFRVGCCHLLVGLLPSKSGPKELVQLWKKPFGEDHKPEQMVGVCEVKDLLRFAQEIIKRTKPKKRREK